MHHHLTDQAMRDILLGDNETEKSKYSSISAKLIDYFKDRLNNPEQHREKIHMKQSIIESLTKSVELIKRSKGISIENLDTYEQYQNFKSSPMEMINEIGEEENFGDSESLSQRESKQGNSLITIKNQLDQMEERHKALDSSEVSKIELDFSADSQYSKIQKEKLIELQDEMSDFNNLKEAELEISPIKKSQERSFKKKGNRRATLS